MIRLRSIAPRQATYDLPTSENVGRLARQGVMWSGLLTMSRQVLSTLVTAILARILLPGDYGLVGMAATLTALVAVFSDMGLSWATVQSKDLSAQQVHNLFWVNSTVGILLWLVCAALAPAIAAFYSEPRLTLITIVGGASFAVGGFSVQPMALLQRQMQFKQLVVVQIGSVMVGGTTAIGLATAGWGYWALVWQGLMSGCVQLILVLLVTGYRPGSPARGAGTRTLLHFGGLLAASGLLIYFARNLDNILVGRVWGAAELGYYSRAYFLMMLPNLLIMGAFANVMIPALSALQNDRERFGDAYRNVLWVVAVVGCPLATGLGLVASEVVPLMYGPRWNQTIPILQWLSVSAILQPLYSTSGWLFTARGRMRPYFVVSIYYTIVTSASFALGVHFGVVGIARTYSFAFALLVTGPVLYVSHRVGNIPFDMSLQVMRPIAFAIVGMIVVVTVVGTLAQYEEFHLLTSFAIKVISGAFIYVIAMLTLDDRARSYVRYFGERMRWSR